MKITVRYKKVIDSVVFHDADKINQKALADKLGVTRSMVGLMIKTGDVPARFIPLIKKIRLTDVITHRKRPTKNHDKENGS